MDTKDALISRNLYQALIVAEMVYELEKCEGPTTLAIVLTDKHQAVLQSISDEEIMRLSTYLMGLERARLFTAYSRLRKAAQDAAGVAGEAGSRLDTPSELDPTPELKIGQQESARDSSERG